MVAVGTLKEDAFLIRISNGLDGVVNRAIHDLTDSEWNHIQSNAHVIYWDKSLQDITMPMTEKATANIPR